MPELRRQTVTGYGRTAFERVGARLLMDDPSPDACWEWPGSTNGRGYGELRVDGRKLYVHRVVADFLFGPLRPGQVVLHRCDNPRCARASHLEVGSQARNMRDAGSKGRMSWRTRRTHCRNGHEYTEENTLFRANGHRRCRECENAPRRKGKRAIYQRRMK